MNKVVRAILSACLFLLWLLFIPNSAYVIVDVRHIAGFCNNSYYYNCIDKIWVILFFFIYGLTGFYGFVFVLKHSAQEFKELFDYKILKYFPYIVMPLVALGVLLGMVNRLNSWDAVLSPWEVMRQVKLYFVSFTHFISFIYITIFYALAYLAGSKIFKFPKKWIK